MLAQVDWIEQRVGTIEVKYSCATPDKWNRTAGADEERKAEERFDRELQGRGTAGFGG
jgi:hypothetical protein